MSRPAPDARARFCDHCGLPVGPGGARRRLEGEERAFCCLGCLVAFRLAGSEAGRGASQSAVQLARIGMGVLLSSLVMTIQSVQYLEPAAAAGEEYRTWAPWAQMAATVPVLLFLGVPLLWNALLQALRGRIVADLLIGLGVAAGFVASTVATVGATGGPLYFDTVAGLATLVAVGRWLEASAKERATAGLRSFLSASERPARRVRAGAEGEREEEVAASDLAVGDLVRVRPGERIPSDGVVRRGRALLDEAALTGEPLPRPVEPGEAVRAPAIPTDGEIEVEVTAVGEGTLLAEVGRVLERARAERAPIERIADRVSAVFVPGVLLLAVLVGAVDVGRGGAPDAALMHALAILVIACPCALGIATPLAVTAALGRLAERGILVRTGSALADLPRVRTVAFDKTGTLTEGRPEVGEVLPAEGRRPEAVLALAASLEQSSEHSLARGIVEAARSRGLSLRRCVASRVEPGRGIEGEVEHDGERRRVRVGSGSWLGVETGRAQVAVEVDGRIEGTVRLADALRPSARAAVAGLRARGVDVVVLSGDSPENARGVAAALGLPPEAARGGLLPSAKVEAVVALARARPGSVAFVGDGLNDAPALAAADLGIAVGSGTDLARETAAVSLLGDDLSRVPALLAAASRTRRAVAGNLFWAFAYNLAALAVTVTREVPPVLAALAMVLSSLSVVGNSAWLRSALSRDLAEAGRPPPGAAAGTGG